MKFRFLTIFLLLTLNSCSLFKKHKIVPFTFHSETELINEKEPISNLEPPKIIPKNDIVVNQDKSEAYSNKPKTANKNDVRQKRKESVNHTLIEKKEVLSATNQKNDPNYLSIYLEILYGMFITTIPLNMNLVSFEFGGLVFSLLVLGYIAWIIYYIKNKPYLNFKEILNLSLPIIIPNTILSTQILLKEILQTQFVYTSYVLGFGILIVLFLLIYILLAVYGGEESFLKSLRALMNFIKFWNFIFTICFVAEFFIFLI